MVRGKRQAVDSAFIKANASLDSLIEKPIVDEEEIKEDVGVYCKELNKQQWVQNQAQSEPNYPQRQRYA